MATARSSLGHGTARSRRLLGLVGGIALALGLTAMPAPAWGSAAPALPGPPPGAEQGFPAGPAPGTVPAAGPVGPAASLPTVFAGAGLRSGFVSVRGRQLTLAIACRRGGQVTLTASALGSGVLARGGYACAHGQGSAELSLRPGAAGRLAALKSTVARVALGSGNAERFSITLGARPTVPRDWSNGGMECSFLGPNEPYLVAPNFTVMPPVIIDVRPWVAWYTPANGWRWLGTTGVNSSSWYRWSATPTGVATWMTPAGALNPWTWAPIHVPAGKQTYAVAAFEVIYWYAHPRYVWAYAPSHLNATVAGSYCTFP